MVAYLSSGIEIYQRVYYRAISSLMTTLQLLNRYFSSHLDIPARLLEHNLYLAFEVSHVRVHRPSSTAVST
jgi:hypothetical protein